MPAVAIIGAGFSGTMTAARLLTMAARPIEVILIDRSRSFGRGVAYGATYPEHLLNVPAGNMSALAEDTDHFVRWAQRNDPRASGGSFLPRMLYGEYLGSNLDEAERGAGRGCSLVRIGEDAIAVHPAGDARSATVTLRSGRKVSAERVVLAIGNLPPADPPVADMSFYASDRYVRDPWRLGAFDAFGERGPVLLIGTGLTMVDVALTLRNRGLASAMCAISRHGLLPQPHRLVPHPPDPDAPKPPIERWPRTAVGMFRGLREAVREAARRGADWRDVVTSIRPATPALWASLPPVEQARFMRHLRHFWDSHRHRAAPEVAAALQDLIDRRMLSIHAGRLVACRPAAGSVEVIWRARGGDSTQTLRVARVINCTGPTSDFKRVEDPLVVQLREAGLILPDPLGLGLLTSPAAAALDSRGRASSALFIAGPARRAQLWEHTAVPELRVGAASLAAHLHSTLE